MSVVIPRTSNPREVRADRIGPRPGSPLPQRIGREREADSRDSRSSRAFPGTLGYDGLQQALAAMPEQPGSAAGTLLVALIHSMGGAATSVARGLYVNTLT